MEELEGAVARFGCNLLPGFRFYGKKEKGGLKVFAYSGGALPKLPFDWVGVHFGDLAEGVFTPSIEGAQKLAAKKNVVEISEESARAYFRGEYIAVDDKFEGVILLKLKGKNIAPAKAENGVAKNILPKSRLATR
jgi:NOL1/NOP2/fmu family ribosome biogenesis protein